MSITDTTSEVCTRCQCAGPQPCDPCRLDLVLAKVRAGEPLMSEAARKTYALHLADRVHSFGWDALTELEHRVLVDQVITAAIPNKELRWIEVCEAFAERAAWEADPPGYANQHTLRPSTAGEQTSDRLAAALRALLAVKVGA